MKIELIAERVGIYGGLRRMYHLAEYFTEAGHTAVINIKSGEKCTWFRHSVTENQEIDPDIRICSEPYQILHPEAKNILYYQAQFDAPLPGFDKIVTTSSHLANILAGYRADSVEIIPYGIDKKIFKEWCCEGTGCKSGGIIRNRIGYMPRKNASEAELVKMLLAQEKIDWLSIDNCSQEEVVKHLQTCNIFIAISRTEGFGLTPFEAMLCGCLVIGYHGNGGKDWLTSETFVPASNPQEIAELIKLGLLGAFERIRKNGKEMVLTSLTPDIEKKSWLKLIEGL